MKPGLFKSCELNCLCCIQNFEDHRLITKLTKICFLLCYENLTNKHAYTCFTYIIREVHGITVYPIVDYIYIYSFASTVIDKWNIFSLDFVKMTSFKRP